MKAEEIKKLADLICAEIKETHISWVLLTNTFAYKIKKPIHTSFLDYSSLMKRKRFCLEELSLNQELSPSVYLEVVAVKKQMNEFLFVSRTDKPVEYAVKMKKLKPGKQMDKMMKEGKVKEKHVKRIAKKLAAFHAQSAPVTQAISLEQRIRQVEDILFLKDEWIRLFGNKMASRVEKTVGKAVHYLREENEYFKERLENGFYKDCHGDLHMGNIFLYNPPVLFDRIEFSRDFRFIDVLHEAGFLAMDIEAHGSKKLSKEFIKHYLRYAKLKIGKKEKRLLHYYQSYTSNIRAKVIMMKKEKSKADIRNIRNYLRLMIDHCP